VTRLTSLRRNRDFVLVRPGQVFSTGRTQATDAVFTVVWGLLAFCATVSPSIRRAPSLAAVATA
jgi:hypothetical protein